MLSVRKIYLRETQIRSLQKDEEIQALEMHIHALRDIIQTQGMELPSENSVSAPAPAPSSGSMAAPLSRAGEEFEPLPIWDFGSGTIEPAWGSTNAPCSAEPHNNGWGAPSPAPTQERYHGFSDSSMEQPTHRKYGKNSYQKGFKGKGHKGPGGKAHNAPHSQGKQGRDSYEDWKRD